MKPVKNDAQLDFELKELHTITRNWDANLAFKAGETAALEKKIHTMLRSGSVPADAAGTILLLIDRINFRIARLKNALPAQLNMLDYLESGTGNYFSLDLLENHARLEQGNDAVDQLFLDLKAEMQRADEHAAVCLL